MRLWIDTDVGSDPDDAFALLAAAGHPDVEPVGVSTVDGDTESRAELARTLVDAPVVAGEQFTGAVLEAARPEAVLAIGPLTNIARLLRSGVALPALAVMGGALRPTRHRGSVHEIEHNFGRDPEAAQRVIRLAPGLLVCPLDVTALMRVAPAMLDRFVEAAPVLADAAEGWVTSQRAAGVPEEGAVVCLHDPLALLALLDEVVVGMRRVRLVVDRDGRLSERDDGRDCDVVSRVDVPSALERMLELVALAEIPPQ